VEEGSNPGLYPVEVLLVLIDLCQRLNHLNFRRFEPVLHRSRWVEVVAAVAQNVHSRSSCSGSTTSDSRYSLNFKRFEPVLHSSRWVEEASFICCERNTPSIAKSRRISLDQVLAVELFEFQDYWAGLALKSLSGISVQSRYNSSGITTRNQSAVELILTLDYYFKTFEPVQHWSRSVESVEEASNLGMFPVESVLLVAYQWLNWSTHSLIAVELNWFSGRLSRSYTQVAGCGSVQSRYVSSWMTTRNQSVVELIHSLTHSSW